MKMVTVAYVASALVVTAGLVLVEASHHKNRFFNNIASSLMNGIMGGGIPGIGNPSPGLSTPGMGAYMGMPPASTPPFASPPVYPPQVYGQVPVQQVVIPPVASPPVATPPEAEEVPPPPPQQEESPDTEEEEEEAAAAISPDTAVELKKLIASQQNDLLSLQNQINTLLEELKSHRERAENERLQAASGGQKNKLEMDVEFPSKEKAEALKKAAGKGGAEKGETDAAKEEAALAVKGPIPVMAIRPDSMEDVEDAAENVLKQEKAQTAIEEEEGRAPPTLQLKTPEERINDAVEKIDSLEAEKADILASQAIAKGKVGHHGFLS